MVDETVLPPGDVASSRAAELKTIHAIARARSPEPPNVLLVATLFKLPYRVLRCLTEAGANVFVLGAAGANGLRHSRYCRRFSRFGGQIDGGLNVELVLEINRAVEALSIDLVVAGDAPSTRSLVEISGVLDAPCFPMPDVEAFDLLNDKWRFTKLCNELGILCPKSWLFAKAEQLNNEILSGNVSLPIIAKPLSQDSGRGCIAVTRDKAVRALGKISYSPIIVQDYIAGIDIGSSVFCRNGEIEAYLVHSYLNGVYTAYSEPKIYRSIARIVRHLRLTGIFNFDMRLTPDGEVFFLECNPRAFFKVAMSMLAGVNFMGFGFPTRGEREMPSLVRPVAVRFPKAMLPLLLTPWRFDAAALRVVKYIARDPVPYLRETLGLERGH